MKKLILTLALLGLTWVASAQSVSTRNSVVYWDSVTDTNATVTGYDVAIALTNVTLSTDASLPSGAGVLGAMRNSGQTDTNAPVAEFVAASVGSGLYNYWVRTVGQFGTLTNVLVSDWTNLTAYYVKNPRQPGNIKIR